jgi:hypothetical protein
LPADGGACWSVLPFTKHEESVEKKSRNDAVANRRTTMWFIIMYVFVAVLGCGCCVSTCGGRFGLRFLVPFPHTTEPHRYRTVCGSDPFECLHRI